MHYLMGILAAGQGMGEQFQSIQRPSSSSPLSRLFYRRRCQKPLQWHPARQGPRIPLRGEDGGEGPVGQQDRVHPVGGRLHHRPGQHVALPLPVLQKRRR